MGSMLLESVVATGYIGLGNARHFHVRLHFGDFTQRSTHYDFPFHCGRDEEVAEHLVVETLQKAAQVIFL